MTLTATLSLLLFLFPLAYSPGPGNLFFAANGARFGLWATLPANLGYHLATFAVTVALGLGAGQVLLAAPWAMALLRVAGGAYVLWLAWQVFAAPPLDQSAQATPAGPAEGALLLLLNPKAYVIIALMVSQFLTIGDTLSVLWIATVFTLNNLLAFLLWTALGDRLAARFRAGDSGRALNRAFGTLLGGVGVWMLIG